MNRKNNGYILVVTLMILSLAMILVSFIINRFTVFAPSIYTMIEREKARSMALSGLEMAMSQLGYADVIEREEGKGDQGAKQSQSQQQKQQQTLQQAPQGQQQTLQSKKMFLTLYQLINSWQAVHLDAITDGIDADIKFYITAEDGKININELYDFEKHTFVGSQKEKDETKKILQEIFSHIRQTGEGNLFESLQQYLSTRTNRLSDITQLLPVKGFELFKNTIFTMQDQKGSDKSKKIVYMTDLFTLWSGKHTVDPWLFSRSLKSLLNLSDTPNKSAVKELVKSFKETYTWPADWNSIFAKIYKKEFANLPKEITALLATQWGPEFFSVTVYATVGQVTQRLYAIVQRSRQDRDAQDPATVIIKKFYWI